MKSIGTKSLIILIVFVTMFLYLVTRQFSALNMIMQMDARLIFGVGFFATLVSAVVYRAFHLDSTSSSAMHLCYPGRAPFGTLLFYVRGYALCVSNNLATEAFEIKPTVRRALLFLFFLICGFSFFSYRELHLMQNLDQAHYLGKQKYCALNDNTVPVEQDRPECRLVYRAFALGYIKDLGDCGRKEEDKPTFCDLQYRDEPNLHFAYRLFNRHTGKIAKDIGEKKLSDFPEKLRGDVDRFVPLVKVHHSEINNDPRAYHMLITNLPNPKGALAQKWFQLAKDVTCAGEYKHLSNVPPPMDEEKGTSKNFNHAVGHLLFDNTYPLTVARCQEYDIVWGVADDFCEKLNQNPESILAELGAMPKIEKVLEYYTLKKMLRPNLKFRTPEEFISVNCLIYAGATKNNAQPVIRKVQLGENTFSIRWQKVAAVTNDNPSKQLFQQTSQLMVKNFKYSDLQSRANLATQPNVSVSEDLFMGLDYRLSRLEYLRDADVFLGQSWLEKRADLMEIYPFYVHLSHYVDTFRQAYRVQRGRVQ